MELLPLPKIHVARGALEALGPWIQQNDFRRVLLISDPGLVACGITARACRQLDGAGVPYTVFDEVEPDPTIAGVMAAAERARALEADGLVAVGGGSVLDTTKIASLLLRNPGTVADYFESTASARPGAPWAAVATTAGTGSEVTAVSVVSDVDAGVKRGVVGAQMLPQLALLDPTLTLGLPASITAATGYDALSHAVEAYTAQRRSPHSDALALAAVTLVGKHLLGAFNSPQSLEHRQGMMQASLFGGMAFANAGVGLAHALAYPLGAQVHVSHGVGVALWLPDVMAHNAVTEAERDGLLARAYLSGRWQGQDAGSVDARPEAGPPPSFASLLRTLRRDLALPGSLQEVGVSRADVPQMVRQALQIQRLVDNNARGITLEQAEAMGLACWRGVPALAPAMARCA